MAGGAASARLHWIKRQLLRGRDVDVRMSYNTATRTEKVKFRLRNCTCQGHLRPSILAAIGSLEDAIVNTVVTDKGHTSSAGGTVVEFWIRSIAVVGGSLQGACTGSDTGCTVSGDPLWSAGSGTDPAGLVVNGDDDGEGSAVCEHDAAMGGVVSTTGVWVPVDNDATMVVNTAPAVSAASVQTDLSTSNYESDALGEAVTRMDELASVLAMVLAELGEILGIIPPNLQGSLLEGMRMWLTRLLPFDRYLIPTRPSAPAVD